MADKKGDKGEIKQERVVSNVNIRQKRSMPRQRKNMREDTEQERIE